MAIFRSSAKIPCVDQTSTPDRDWHLPRPLRRAQDSSTDGYARWATRFTHTVRRTPSVSRQIWAHGKYKITKENSCEWLLHSCMGTKLPDRDLIRGNYGIYRKCYTWRYYSRSEMTNHSNDLDLSRLILGDVMFCFDNDAHRDKASVDMKFGGHWSRVRGKCRIMSWSDDIWGCIRA